MSAVVDTSALIVLGHLELALLFSDVYAPESVVAEWSAGSDLSLEQAGASEGLPLNWLHVRSVAVRAEATLRGELEVIELAGQINADFVAIDDLPARRRAQAAGLRVIGTLGILTAARELGAIPSVVALLPRLREINLYLSDSLIDAINRAEA